MNKLDLKESIRFKDLKELSLDEFELKCSDVKNTLELRNEIINGSVYIIRRVLKKERSETLLKKIINSNLKFTTDPKIKEGVENLYFESNNMKSKKAVWDYVQSLFVLGEIIVGKNKELFDKYNSLYVTDYKKEISNLHTNNFSVDFLSKLNS